MTANPASSPPAYPHPTVRRRLLRRLFPLYVGGRLFSLLEYAPFLVLMPLFLVCVLIAEIPGILKTAILKAAVAKTLFRNPRIRFRFRPQLKGLIEIIRNLWKAAREGWHGWRERRADDQDTFRLTADPNAAPERLRTAAQRLGPFGPSANPACLSALLCAHPNTPAESLLELLKWHPRPASLGLSLNPVLPLLPLLCPVFVARL
jgi:hypothetical protein